MCTNKKKRLAKICVDECHAVVFVEQWIMNPERKFWNQQQQALRKILAHPETFQTGIDLFLCQHAMVHAAQMSQAGLWSFEDETLQGVSEDQLRSIPRDAEHSIAWMVWHMTRCEDVTMNLLAAGRPQVLLQEGWLARMQISAQDTGNAMAAAQVADFSTAIDLEALQAYRRSVGRRTRLIAMTLLPEQLKQKVDPTRLRQITHEGAVVEAASGLLDYWSGLTIAGILLMPPTRHNFVHWNEALRIKQKLKEPIRK